jgi:hypothetical protein
MSTSIVNIGEFAVNTAFVQAVVKGLHGDRERGTTIYMTTEHSQIKSLWTPTPYEEVVAAMMSTEAAK